MNIPPDMASECVEIVLSISKFAQTEPPAKAVLIETDLLMRINGTADRIDQYRAFHKIMTNGESA